MWKSRTRKRRWPNSNGSCSGSKPNTTRNIISLSKPRARAARLPRRIHRQASERTLTPALLSHPMGEGEGEDLLFLKHPTTNIQQPTPKVIGNVTNARTSLPKLSAVPALAIDQWGRGRVAKLRQDDQGGQNSQGATAQPQQRGGDCEEFHAQSRGDDKAQRPCEGMRTHIP